MLTSAWDVLESGRMYRWPLGPWTGSLWALAGSAGAPWQVEEAEFELRVAKDFQVQLEAVDNSARIVVLPMSSAQSSGSAPVR